MDRATGEEYDLDAAQLARVVGIEASYIDWVIATDGAFDNPRWRVVKG